MTEEKTYPLPEKLGNALVQYLALRPYGEVYQLIVALQQLAKPDHAVLNGATESPFVSRMS